MKLLFYYQHGNNECYRQETELYNNTPFCDIIFKNCDDDYILWEAEQKGITTVPVCILYSDVDCINEITRWNDFVTTETINKTIKNYETKHLVQVL